jgi:hypothetical protein
MNEPQSAAGLEITLLRRDNDVCDLGVSAWSGAFRAVTEIHSEVGCLEDLAEKLTGFPRNPDDAREVVLGTYHRRLAGGGAKLKFFCADRAGHSYFECTIESAMDSRNVFQHARISMPVEAAAVDLFVRDLRRVERERTGGVTLRSSG